ncbi:MAG: flavodoxin-dependent (E)-4-hydroxy-3-methylbut-2-enyl-diphosphate synthase [Candidatus Omnitrophica bacterium]|nr:flavodoxin-dependent (E)-4-hydroxy-3-methylbut-2-enyl-diphosphate synthase [Candidatus Omnitrophota bacterium]
MDKRRIQIGNVKIGGNHPIAIQSMTNTLTADIKKTVNQIKRLSNAGCQLVRVAVKTQDDALAIAKIKNQISIPIIADIHFDYRLAIASMNAGVDKIRINPGNIKNKKHLDQIIQTAKEKKIPIRIGVNSGSLPGYNDSKKYKVTRDSMIKALDGHIKYFEKRDFKEIVISLKASDAKTTIDAYRKAFDQFPYPIHLGLTAAGLYKDSIVRSSVALGGLIVDGIGNTVRISITGDPVEEVYAAKQILSAAGVRSFGPEIIACPTCGRCQVDLVKITKEVESRMSKVEGSKQAPLTNRSITIAVMGCEVNGPGEAKHADIGIAFGNNKGAIFQKGKIVKVVSLDDAVEELIKLAYSE